MNQSIINLIISIKNGLKKFNYQKTNFFKTKNNKIIDPVTKLDIKIEKYIRSKIKSKFPMHSIIGEELSNKNDDDENKWFIDPIDGTKNYLMDLPTWSNLIGYYHKRKPEVGFANFPMLEKCYLAYQKRTYLISSNNKKIIKSNKKTRLKNAKIAINTFRTVKIKKIRKFINSFKGIFRITGCDAYNFCLIAEGKVDVLIESGLKQVDILPLIPIIENSGAIITNWRGEKNFKKGDILVTGNSILHKKLIKIIN